MRYRERALGARLEKLTKNFPIVVVSGARQIGKSTLVRHILHNWEVVTLDPAIDIANARSEPDLFLSNFPPPLIIDEIQYAPELVAALKRRVDADRSPGQYVLTGSQQWQVLRSARESLAGRAVFLDLEGFSLHELGDSAGSRSWLTEYLESPHAFVQRSGSRPISRLSVERPLHSVARGPYRPGDKPIAARSRARHDPANRRTLARHAHRNLPVAGSTPLQRQRGQAHQ